MNHATMAHSRCEVLRAKGQHRRNVHGPLRFRYVGCVKVYGVQFDIRWERKEENFAKVETMLERVAPERGSLVALPEMFATGFSMNAEQIAESYGGRTEEFLRNIARRWGVYIMAGAAMRNKAGVARNKALLFNPEGGLAAWYAKQRPFSLGGEHEHFQAGTKHTVAQLPGFKAALYVCYDLRFPELFRAAALAARPELHVVIANWPEKRIQHWVRLLQARAIENQAYVLGVNRIGADPYFTSGGRSMLVDADGEIVLDAGTSEEVLQGELDLARLEKFRKGLPFLDDLRAMVIGGEQ